MTTNKEALDKIFEAALRETDKPAPSPRVVRRPPQEITRSLETNAAVNAVLATPPPRRPIRPVCTNVEIPMEVSRRERRSAKKLAKSESEQRRRDTLFDDAAADKLGALLDQKFKKEAISRKRAKYATIAVAVIAIGSVIGWFTQNPDRLQAITAAISEIRSVTDINQVVGGYEESLDKVSSRSAQIDHASGALGIDPTTVEHEDPNMDTEMKAMMGGEGSTTGDRARALQAAFGSDQNAGGTIQTSKSLNKD